MAKFSTFLLLSILGLSLAVASAQGQNAQAANPLALLANPDALLSPETQCPGLCATGCALTKLTCTDIPDIMDCAQMDTACNGQCGQLCGCLTDCSTNCIANYPCSENTDATISQMGCLSQRLICKGTCQMNCPGTLMIQGLSSVVQMSLAAVTQLMAPPPNK